MRGIFQQSVENGFPEVFVHESSGGELDRMLVTESPGEISLVVVIPMMRRIANSTHIDNNRALGQELSISGSYDNGIAILRKQ